MPSISLFSLRHSAKEVLALSLKEIFPEAQLLGGGVTEVDFYYDVIFPPKCVHHFGEQELRRVEDHLFRIVQEKRPLQHSEMVAVSAASFLLHKGQPYLAEQLEALPPKELVDIMQIGPYVGVCPSPYPPDTSAFGALALLEAEKLEEADEWRIRGTVFFNKEDLKKYLKQFREAKKKDYRVQGPQLSLWGEDKHHHLIYLPEGEALLHAFKENFREILVEQEFTFLHTPSSLPSEAIHQWGFEKRGRKRPSRFAHFDLSGKLHTSEFPPANQLLETLISSLQFIEETIKIFGLRYVLRMTGPRRLKNSGDGKVIQEALSILQWKEEPFEDDPFFSDEKKASLMFFLCDAYGREEEGPVIGVDSEKGVVYRSFGSLEQWIQLGIEQFTPAELLARIEA